MRWDVAIVMGVMIAIGSAGCDAGGRSEDTVDNVPAPDPDGGSEPEPDPNPLGQLGPITVRVRFNEQPAGGVKVVTHDARGEPLSVYTSDDNGVVDAEVYDGGMVTAVFAPCSLDYPACLRTYVGVMRGDDLTIDAYESFFPDFFSARVQLPGAYEGADSYIASTGCTSEESRTAGAPILVRRLTSRCFGDPERPRLQVLGIALANGVPIAFASKADAEVPEEGEAIELGSWSDATSDFQVLFGALGSTPWRVSVSEEDGAARHSLLSATTQGEQPLTAVRPVLPGFFISVFARADVGRTDRSAGTTVIRRYRGPTNEASLVVDTAAPQIIDVRASIDLDRGPIVTWAVDGARDLDTARVEVFTHDGVRWFVEAPARGRMDFPPLPPELAEHKPSWVFALKRVDLSLEGANGSGQAEFESISLSTSELGPPSIEPTAR